MAVQSDKVPPDPGVKSYMSYAERASMNVRFDQRLKRNVLEIEVEKDNEEEEMLLTEVTIAKLLNKIKLNIHTTWKGTKLVLVVRRQKFKYCASRTLSWSSSLLPIVSRLKKVSKQTLSDLLVEKT